MRRPPERSLAIKSGQSKYFTGRPCKHGHIDWRITRDGRCITCAKIAALQYDVENREKRRLAVLERRAKDRDGNRAQYRKYYQNHKLKKQQAAREYRAANSEKCRISNRASEAKFPEKKKARLKAWRELNPEAGSVYAARRRMRLKAVGGHHTLEDRKRVRRLQNNRCAWAIFNFEWCEKTLKNGRWDHRVPISKGGSNEARNGQILCHGCNQRKYTSDERNFLIRAGVVDLFTCNAVDGAQNIL